LLLVVLVLVLGMASAQPPTNDTTRSIFLGINIDPMNPNGGNATSAQISALKSSWVRIEYKDSSTGAPSEFGFYDPIVEEFINANISVLFTLDYSSYPGKPAYSAPLSQWEDYIPKFVMRCAAVAAHYSGKVGAFEIWNEEDLLPQPGYDPGVPANIFATLLKWANGNVSKAAPKSAVVMGGLASGNLGYLSTVLSLNGGSLPASGLGLHPYARRPFQNWPSSTWGVGPMDPFLMSYNKLVPKIPIWITEVGTNDMAVQGSFPFMTFEAVNEMPNIVPYVFWFCWSDGMVDPFGLVDKQGNKKPSYYSFQKFGGLPYVANQTV